MEYLNINLINSHNLIRIYIIIYNKLYNDIFSFNYEY